MKAGILESKKHAASAQIEPNTFIGGMASVIPDRATLASRLNILESNISLFTTSGNDIAARIDVNYTIPFAAFDTNSTGLTYYDDSLEGKVQQVSPSGFKLYQNNVVKRIELPGCTYIDNSAFQYANRYFTLNIPKASLGTTEGSNSIFPSVSINIFHKASLLTSNSGGLEGDLASAVSYGSNIKAVTDFTKPNEVNDLSAGVIGSNSIQLNFTAPTGNANQIEAYDVYINGFWKGDILEPGSYIQDLQPNTTYEIEIRPRDIYFNKSTSNKITQTTASNKILVDDVLIAGFRRKILSKKTYQKSLNVTYQAGLVGETAVFNGATSVIDFLDVINEFNGVDFTVLQLFKTTQTSFFRLFSNGHYSSLPGFSVLGGGGWIYTGLKDTQGNSLSMNNIPYNESDGNWHVVALTWKTATGTAIMHIDGENKGSKTNANMIGGNFNSNNLRFGASSHGVTYFNGQADEGYVIKKALTDTEHSNYAAQLLAGTALI